ncbi:HRDC domain-containing protein [Paenibacillus elgii]|uniref:HRDC domain-containing protein n=1 Tax=Paenibacillus elgii TaxID=189691 RepID=UPI002041469E|nr:HRDC domain-containing protein [Paenibacillus elgii]MCM3268265.1 HRDC domain-containing protein [Paenibacillus elgii]
MNLVFLNSLEKATEEGNVRTAQVTIGENQGTWMVMWNETREDGRRVQECWYEGLRWEEMLAIFRERVFAKQCGGYKPIVQVNVSEIDVLDRRTAYIQRLHFYGEKHANEELFDKLRDWRFKQASRDGKAAYLIATNRLLKMISAFVPHTEEELLHLPGFGKAKAAAYAADIVAITTGFQRDTDFPLSWVAESIDPGELNAWLLQENERKQKAEEEKREIKHKLLEAIARGEKLEELLEQTKLQRRNLLQLFEELDREGYDLQNYIEGQLEQVPEPERELAWKAFQQQGDRYLKPILQTVYSQKELTAQDADRVYEWLRMLRMKFRRENEQKTVEAS